MHRVQEGETERVYDLDACCEGVRLLTTAEWREMTEGAGVRKVQ